MEGGDLQTTNRPYRGNGMQHQHGGIFKFLGNLLGFGPEELQKQMSDPVKQQMLMQRGGFPWALAGLLPLVLGNGSVENQMKTARDPIMQRGGLVRTSCSHLQRSTSLETDRSSSGPGRPGISWR